MWCVTALRAHASCMCGIWRAAQLSQWAPWWKPTGPPLRPAELVCKPISPLMVSLSCCYGIRLSSQLLAIVYCAVPKDCLHMNCSQSREEE